MTNEHQDKINSILDEVSKGEYPVQPYRAITAKCDQEHLVCVRHSLETFGQLSDIIVTSRDLNSDNPIVEVVDGNKRHGIIEQFRQEGKLNFIPKYRFVEVKDADAIYAAATFIKDTYTKLQQGFYGAVHLYDGVATMAKANQQANAKVDNHIDTCVEVGKLCECNEKFVRLGRRAALLDKWLYAYVYEDRNNMPVQDIKDLLKLANLQAQRDVIDMMKKLYDEDKAKAAKAAAKPSKKKEVTPNDAEGDDVEVEVEDEDILYSGFGKDPKSLYKRARAKIDYLNPENLGKVDNGRVSSTHGKRKPSQEEVDRERQRQAQEGLEEKVVYVDEYGDGDEVMTVSFELPEHLAEVIAVSCKAYGINVTIFVDRVKRLAA